MSDRVQHPPLRYRRLRGGYRKEDVEFALAELRLNLHNLGTDLEALRGRARELEEELRTTREELETSRTRELELSQTMAGILQRANEIEESAHERARAIVAEAEEAAQRSRAEAVRRVEETSGQFNEILRLKENLVGSVRRVVGEFDEALSRVQRGESLFARSAAQELLPAPPPTSPPEFEPWPEPSARPHVDEQPLSRSYVEIDVGPFADAAALSTFERSLAQLPRVDDVYVRRLADERAVIELTLSEPTALLATMREHLPYELQVQTENDSKLVLDIVNRVAGTL